MNAVDAFQPVRYPQSYPGYSCRPTPASRFAVSAQKEIIHILCGHFESKKDWVAFERFPDTLITQAKSPAEWLIFVESCLSDKKNKLASKYFSYVDDKTRLKFAPDCALAEKYLADEDCEKAAQQYADIVNRCGPGDDKALYQFQLCTSAFHASPPADVLPQLDSFIANYGTSHPVLARGAALMKGRLYLQSRRLEAALSQFRAAAADFAGTPQAGKARFFEAYCTMLKEDIPGAAQAFTAVLQDYPESQWARQARLRLAKIKTMTAGQNAAK